jgi:hypothetical protein
MSRAAWCCLLVAAICPGASAAERGTLHILAELPGGTVISNNWSGYAVTSHEGSVTEAEGSWIIPEAVCNDGHRKNTGASFWVGIDGYDSTTVEQTGTDSDCFKGSPKYYAWYEFVPKAGVTIQSLAVSPGDVMAAEVTWDGSRFRVTITDKTTNQSFSISKANPGAKRDSAEWIAEDNSFRFTNFGTVAFGEDNTGVPQTCDAIIDGVTGVIGAFSKYHAIEMETAKTGRVLAVPSALSSDGTSFSVEWH